MIVTIHQPEHLPWLGFFHKAAQADLMVLLDNVPYRHKYFQNRNRIRSNTGECWVNVPVLLKGYGRPALKDVRINATAVRWREKWWRSISVNYRKAKFFEPYAEFFESISTRRWDFLVDLNVELIRYLFHFLGITTPLILASELDVTGSGPDLILGIVQKTGAKCYLSGVSGIAGRGREPEAAFLRKGIEVRYQEFHHPVYRQLHEPFLPSLSAIDLLFNYGPASLDVINGVGVQTIAHIFE